jgi:hypothetical protein
VILDPGSARAAQGATDLNIARLPELLGQKALKTATAFVRRPVMRPPVRTGLARREHAGEAPYRIVDCPRVAL